MKFAYIDESERDEDYYFLGAVVVDESDAHALSLRLHRIMARHSRSFPALSANEEFHASAMMRASSQPWRSLPLRLILGIFREVLQVLVASNSRVYIEGIDVSRQKARGYPNVTPARELAFSHLFEQINGCGSSVERVQVFADNHHTADVSRSNFERYQAHGTYGYRSSNLPWISKDITFINSKSNRILQATDVVTYIYNRVRTRGSASPQAVNAQNDLWALIEPAAKFPRGRNRVWP
ncbi:DUF3800 domain-containing protein [Mycetocola tolaasinivorans]|uniref:DUF3800 domain-containing protein n=1 Tax=Mycetocola tolaasinivorans TaxID=76635 RepID=A0A3L6ZZT9_9MICO|nr:DUF3800 domain-containing protein [Mycetocola tolaasinivorans]RLP73220.1 DUF3800 domain-containing protein [Mycetocola tolaasinivorans]